MKIQRLSNYQYIAKSDFNLILLVCLFGVVGCSISLIRATQSQAQVACVISIFFLALVAFLISNRTCLLFDSKKQEVTLSQGRLILKRKIVVSFEAIKGIKLEKSNIGNNGVGRFVLVLEDRVIPFSSCLHTITPEMEKQVKKLITFMGCEEPLNRYELSLEPRLAPVPPALTAPFDFESINPEVVDLVRKRRSIEAIKLVRNQTGLGLKESKDLVDELQRHLRSEKP